MDWTLSSASTGDVAFFRTGGVVLALYPRELLAADTNVSPEGAGFPGIALAHNLTRRELVDPDGFPWEIAWNPGFPLREDGTIELP